MTVEEFEKAYSRLAKKAEGVKARLRRLVKEAKPLADEAGRLADAAPAGADPKAVDDLDFWSSADREISLAEQSI